MHLFLTSVLPFLAHSHASAAAFLTCRYHNFHASIIPEFLSEEERVRKFCEARQQNQLEVEEETQYTNLYNLFVQTPLMQFSPSLLLCQKDCVESILMPLLDTKYFTRTLQHCSFLFGVAVTNDLLQGLSKVRSLTQLDLGWSIIETKHLEIIINSFPSLETLTLQSASSLNPTTPIRINSPAPPPATKTMRNLEMLSVDPSFAAQFIPIFPNLRKLELSPRSRSQELDLRPLLSSSLPLLEHMSLAYFTLKSTESLKNIVTHLSSLVFYRCLVPDLSFLVQENTNSLPELTTLCVDDCVDLSTSSEFASLTHAPNLHVLAVNSEKFDNDCLQYLENMVHLRKLDLRHSKVTGDSRLLKTLMQNLFQLEELNLSGTFVGGQGGIRGAHYSTHSQLRVLNLSTCGLIDDDLNGIGALKNALEVLDVSVNRELTNEALVHCRDLVKLKVLNFGFCGIKDLSPLQDCLNLGELKVPHCDGLTDDSFKVFSEEPSSFPNLCNLNMSFCRKLTEKVFEHLSKNNYLVCRLKELYAGGMSQRFSSSATARDNICQLKGLRRLNGVRFSMKELVHKLKNIEEVWE